MVETPLEEVEICYTPKGVLVHTHPMVFDHALFDGHNKTTPFIRERGLSNVLLSTIESYRHRLILSVASNHNKAGVQCPVDLAGEIIRGSTVAPPLRRRVHEFTPALPARGSWGASHGFASKAGVSWGAFWRNAVPLSGRSVPNDSGCMVELHTHLPKIMPHFFPLSRSCKTAGTRLLGFYDPENR